MPLQNSKPVGHLNNNQGIPLNQKLRGQMNADEFKAWLMQFDRNGDQRISKEELTNALRKADKWFVPWKSFRGMNHGDVNGDGFIDKDEIDNLAAYAQKRWGIKIVK
ncbi:calmodulin-like protein 5 [Aristolochia californica]|uniref:calmodulin-like protein 5 n=1 Tax=Aristolochia californica TaxID=171875 RepID=UPI0035D9F700